MTTDKPADKDREYLLDGPQFACAKHQSLACYGCHRDHVDRLLLSTIISICALLTGILIGWLWI